MAERILMTNGKLKVTDNPIIPFIEGDGVGRDIWKNAQAIFDKAVEVAYVVLSGKSYWQVKRLLIKQVSGCRKKL